MSWRESPPQWRKSRLARHSTRIEGLPGRSSVYPSSLSTTSLPDSLATPGDPVGQCGDRCQRRQQAEPRRGGHIPPQGRAGKLPGIECEALRQDREIQEAPASEQLLCPEERGRNHVRGKFQARAPILLKIV